MTDASKPWAENWLAAQQAMLQTFMPAFAPAFQGRSAEPGPAREAGLLEAQFAELRDTWQASLRKWSEFAAEAATGEMPSPDKLREIFTPAAWTGPGSGVLDAALQRVLEGPRYAVLWDLDRQLLELQKATLQRDKEVAAYQAVVQKAWNLAFERFAKALASQRQATGTWRSLTDLWLGVANDTLIEVHRSDEFLQAQRRMLRAASDRHLQERKIAEAWCEAAHLPTRSEVDELQRLVVELRREVRLLRRAAVPSAVPPSTDDTGKPGKPARKAAAHAADKGARA